MLTIDQLKRAITIKEQIQQLEADLASVLGGAAPVKASSPTQPVASKGKGKRVVSAAARAKMAASQRARWAKKAGATPAKAPETAKAAPKKKGLSPEGRERLAALMKARWAARKKGAPALNTPAKPAAAAKPAKSAKKQKRNISPEARAKMAAAAKRRWANVKKA